MSSSFPAFSRFSFWTSDWSHFSKQIWSSLAVLKTLVIAEQLSIPKPLIVLSCLAKIYWTSKFEFLLDSFWNCLKSMRVSLIRCSNSDAICLWVMFIL